MVSVLSLGCLGVYGFGCFDYMCVFILVRFLLVCGFFWCFVFYFEGCLQLLLKSLNTTKFVASEGYAKLFSGKH